MITNEILGNSFDWSGAPKRVVSLLPAATETICEIGGASSLVGVSAYCHRYADVSAPVVGEYVRVDYQRIVDLGPDLVIVTSGVQQAVGRRLVEMGMPVYTLGVPATIDAAIGNMVVAAALMDSVAAGRELAKGVRRKIADGDGRRLSAYVEVWFGRHQRTIGGRSFIADIVDLAGGDGLYSGSAEGYLRPDLADVATRRPRVLIGLSEPEYPVDFRVAIEERGWTWPLDLVVSTVDRGMNIIHDGPSLGDTVIWLRQQLAAI